MVKTSVLSYRNNLKGIENTINKVNSLKTNKKTSVSAPPV